MAHEDQTLTCSDCDASFVFTAAEQERFAARGFQPPKRCHDCRKAKRRRRRRGGSGGGKRGGGEYRSPAFHDSEPKSQRHRSSRGGGGSGRGRQRSGEYRSPAFRHLEKQGRGLYRSPAFRDRETVDNDLYRAPAFRDQTFSAAEEYRAPGFQEQRSTDSGGHRGGGHPLFKLVCAECGAEEMVPFLPDELERPLCDGCLDAAHAAPGVTAGSDAGEEPSEPDTSVSEPDETAEEAVNEHPRVESAE